MKRQLLVIGMSFWVVLSFAVGSARAVVVGSWDFEEASGATVLDGVGNFDATIGAGTGSRVATGDFNGGLGQSWSSGTANVQTANYTNEYDSLTSMSLESWIKWDGSNGGHGWLTLNGVFFSLIHTDGPGIRFNIDSKDSLYLPMSNVTPNAWQQWVATYDAGTATLKVYANAVEVFSAGGGAAIDWSLADNDKMGLNSSGTFNDGIDAGAIFKGLVDHLSIHDVALTPAEVEARYQLILGTPDTDFDGLNGTDIADFHILRGNYLLTGMTQPQGDANFDTIVDHKDFFLWRTAFEAGSGSLADINWSPPSVPEPSACVLLLSCGLVFVSCGRIPRQIRK